MGDGIFHLGLILSWPRLAPLRGGRACDVVYGVPCALQKEQGHHVVVVPLRRVRFVSCLAYHYVVLHGGDGAPEGKGRASVFGGSGYLQCYAGMGKRCWH